MPKSKNLTENGKICSVCGIEKSLSDFTKIRKDKEWLHADCNKCRLIAIRERRQRTDVKRKAAEYTRKYRLGIRTPRVFTKRQVYIMARELNCDRIELQKVYDGLYKKQNGVCAICGLPEGDLVIDHNHNMSGIDSVRGLLCHNCNLGIGNLRDSVELCIQASKYLNTATTPS